MGKLRNPYYSGPITDRFDGVRFSSPGQPVPDKGFQELWKWQTGGGKAKWPKQVRVIPVEPPQRSQTPRITMVGHATVLIQVAGVNLLTDPVWSMRAGPLGLSGPKRVTAPGIRFEDLPPIDAVLLSHNHYDHMDMRSLRRLHETHSPLMVMPLGNDAIVGAAIKGAHITTGDWHDRIEITDHVSIHLTAAHHWSARGVRDRRMALWSGFWITTPGVQIWFAGDSGYGDGAIFRDIHTRYGAPDIALIPIGAYAPRWFMSDQHVAPDESVRIFKDVAAKQALGFHWGTFQLTDEAREEPRELLQHHLLENGVEPERFIALDAGDVYQS